MTSFHGSSTTPAPLPEEIEAALEAGLPVGHEIPGTPQQEMDIARADVDAWISKLFLADDWIDPESMLQKINASIDTLVNRAITTALASARAEGAREQREAREMLARKLAMTLKAYRRELPCGCADCAPAGGMHTNGGCRHSPLRSIIAYLTHPTEGHDE